MYTGGASVRVRLWTLVPALAELVSSFDQADHEPVLLLEFHRCPTRGALRLEMAPMRLMDPSAARRHPFPIECEQRYALNGA